MKKITLSANIKTVEIKELLPSWAVIMNYGLTCVETDLTE